MEWTVIITRSGVVVASQPCFENEAEAGAYAAFFAQSVGARSISKRAEGWIEVRI